MRDDDKLLSTPGLSFGSGVIGVCDICHKRQAVIVLQKERYQLCVLDFLNKTFLNSKETPGRPLPPYRSERVWFETETIPAGKAPAIALSPTKPVRRPSVLITPDVFGLTTTTLDAAIRFARQGFEVLLPDVGKTAGVGPADHVSLRSGALLGRGVPVDSARVRRLTGLYRDALRHLRGREMVDAGKTALFGTSFGASLAAVLAGEDRQIGALVLAYPIPLKPADYLKLITAPVLAITGDRDRRSSLARQQLHDFGQRHELSVEFWDVAGARHHFLARDLPQYDLAAAEAAWGRTEKFLRDRLFPPPPKPPTPPRPATAAAPAPPTPAATA